MTYITRGVDFLGGTVLYVARDRPDRVGLVYFEDTCGRCDSLELDKYISLIIFI